MISPISVLFFRVFCVFRGKNCPLVQEARCARGATKSLPRRTIEKAQEDVKQKVRENRKIRREAAEKIDRKILCCILSSKHFTS